MKKLTIVVSICIAATFFSFKNAMACSTFYLESGGQSVFARNADWPFPGILLTVNKRNVTKTALSYDSAQGQPVEWTSKYGSITFVQLEANGGLNEAGLAVEFSALWESEYPAPDSRPYIDNLQWVQYQLDKFSTVEEVIESNSEVRIVPLPTPVNSHYMVCDKTGTCATIEFIEGEFVYHTAESLPVTAITNDTYEDSLSYLSEHIGFGGSLPIDRPVPNTVESIDRFVRIADALKDYDPATSGTPIDYAFEILANEAYMAQWSAVYDMVNLRIHFRTMENDQIRHLDLDAFDFSCETPVKLLDIDDPQALEGDITDHFIDYTYDIYKAHIENANKLDPLSPEEVDARARYRESGVCRKHCNNNSDCASDAMCTDSVCLPSGSDISSDNSSDGDSTCSTVTVGSGIGPKRGFTFVWMLLNLSL